MISLIVKLLNLGVYNHILENIFTNLELPDYIEIYSFFESNFDENYCQMLLKCYKKALDEKTNLKTDYNNNDLSLFYKSIQELNQNKNPASEKFKIFNLFLPIFYSESNNLLTRILSTLKFLDLHEDIEDTQLMDFSRARWTSRFDERQVASNVNDVSLQVLRGFQGASPFGSGQLNFLDAAFIGRSIEPNARDTLIFILHRSIILNDREIHESLSRFLLEYLEHYKFIRCRRYNLEPKSFRFMDQNDDNENFRTPLNFLRNIQFTRKYKNSVIDFNKSITIGSSGIATYSFCVKNFLKVLDGINVKLNLTEEKESFKRIFCDTCKKSKISTFSVFFLIQ